jgi:TonB family protein
MALDRGRWRDIAGSTLGALRRRPRLLFLAGCLVVLVGSWWGTMFFADRLMSGLPDRSAPDAPVPLSEQEIQARIRESQDLNARLRAQRAERAYAHDQARALAGDSLAPALDDGAAAAGLPGPTDYVPTDAPAEPIHTVKPEYPDLARQARVEGTVVVQALVGADGRVLQTRVLRSIPLLDGAAQDAVRRWSFHPAQQGGRPVATWVSVPITFRH